ncbi:MAG: hypothetical protein JNM24_16290 [Bdellovibrionaceae bacterium]|nr:hypothetical protein [Pseudobdellovibrionaceae bacterium]
MKILFASLSRIGDYIQHITVVKAWAVVNPTAEVHVLVNDLIPADLMRMNSQFKHIVVPRFEYQKRINQVGTPLMYPFLGLRRVVQQLQGEKYHKVVDLSLQYQSAAFLKIIDPGFFYTQNEIQAINEYVNPADQTHLIDKLKVAHGVELAPKEANNGFTKRLLLQVTTSDKKKNIDLPKWKSLVEMMRTDFKSIDLKVISSRAEAKQLQTVFSKSELFICNFAELSHALDAETKLISLDTSIKHFATLFGVPTLEISVGSSHWVKNAAYQTGNYIFSAQLDCRPCFHSSACPYGRNQCQDTISFNELNQFVGEWITGSRPTVFPMVSEARDGNLSVSEASNQRGVKWKQKTNPTNLSL